MFVIHILSPQRANDLSAFPNCDGKKVIVMVRNIPRSNAPCRLEGQYWPNSLASLVLV
jgi:hypothetical protein